MSVLVLSQSDIHAALDPAECERAMAAVLAARARGEAYNPLRSLMVPSGAAGFMGLMPAYAGGGAVAGAGGGGVAGAGGGGVAGAGGGGATGATADAVAPGAGVFSLKALCLMPGNPARGLDTHQGTLTLFDGETGMATAILNASGVTEIRTAAVTAVATRTLAREDARVLAILGAGVQARSHLRALSGVRPWEEVRVYAPTTEHAEAVADAGAPGGGPVRVAGSAREAVTEADVVVAVTTAREPVLAHAWLSPGAHVNAVGASSPAARELDTETVAAAAFFCDSRESVRAEAGEFRLALERGAIGGEDHIRAELGEVLAGSAPGRSSPGELTVFRSLGIGVEDLAAAQLAVAVARQRGLGTEVEL